MYGEAFDEQHCLERYADVNGNECLLIDRY